jgi:Skp family chaperone for outer membrane proteins
MQTKLQAMRTQQQSQTAVLSDAAAATMERDISKLTRDLNFAQQEAEVEVQDLREVLMRDLQRKVAAMVAQVAKEKGLLLVVQAETAIYVDPTVDLSDEVARRLDAQPKG